MLDQTLNSICAKAHRLIPHVGVFDSEDILRQYPELHSEPDFFYEIVHEEYRRRQSLDPTFDEDSFFAKFDEKSDDIRAYISVRQAFESETFLTQIESALEPAPGIELGDYLLLERLGRGAFGQVFLARQLSVSGRLVVVKLARVVEKEVHALSQLSQCKHIVPIYTVTPINEWDVHAICMPYLGRVTMQDVLESWRAPRLKGARRREGQNPGELQPLELASEVGSFVHDRNRKAFTVNADEVNEFDVDAASDWHRELQRVWEEDIAEAKATNAWRGTYTEWVLRRGLELLDALHEAHRRKLLHCDVKPSNVLVNDRGEALLFDFNLTKGCDSRIGGGTLPYMAPEQLRVTAGEAGDDRLTVKTDLFAWGVTVIQMLTGELAYGGFSNTHSCDQLADDQARRLLRRQQMGRNDWHELLAGIPPEMVDLIVSTIEFDPADRPESARSLATQLRLAASTSEGLDIDDYQVAVGSSTPVASYAGSRQRHPWLSGATAIPLISLIVFSSFLVAWMFGLFSPKGRQLVGEKLEYQIVVRSFIENREIDNFDVWNVLASREGVPAIERRLEYSFQDAYNVRFSEDHLSRSGGHVYLGSANMYKRNGEITREDYGRMVVNEWDRRLQDGKIYNLTVAYSKEDLAKVDAHDVRSSYFHCLAVKDLLEFVDSVSNTPRTTWDTPPLNGEREPRTPEECLDSAERHLQLAIENRPTANDYLIERAQILLGKAYIGNEMLIRPNVSAAVAALQRVEGILPAEEMSHLIKICEDFPLDYTQADFKATALAQIEKFADQVMANRRRFSNRRNASRRFRDEFEIETEMPWEERHKLPF